MTIMVFRVSGVFFYPHGKDRARMLPPRRHRHRIERCAACDRRIGAVRPSSGGGTYLVVDTVVTGINWSESTHGWKIVCPCGRVTDWRGKEIKWHNPFEDAA